jgi:hypothetical protein
MTNFGQKLNLFSSFKSTGFQPVVGLILDFFKYREQRFDSETHDMILNLFNESIGISAHIKTRDKVTFFTSFKEDFVLLEELYIKWQKVKVEEQIDVYKQMRDLIPSMFERFKSQEIYEKVNSLIGGRVAIR